MKVLSLDENTYLVLDNLKFCQAKNWDTINNRVDVKFIYGDNSVISHGMSIDAREALYVYLNEDPILEVLKDIRNNI